jgi:hypothetical protein
MDDVDDGYSIAWLIDNTGLFNIIVIIGYMSSLIISDLHL